MKRSSIFFIQKTMGMILFTMLLLPIMAVAGESPFDGTWKLDLGDGQEQVQAEFLLDNGVFQRISPEPRLKVKADGTDRPIPPENITLADTSAAKILDKNTIQITGKSEGRVAFIETLTVSSDGKKLTMDQTVYYPNSPDPVKWEDTMDRVSMGPAGSHAISGVWRSQKDTLKGSENVLTTIFKSTQNGLMYTSPTGESCDAKFDGKYYPVEGGVPGVSMAITKENESSIIMNYKRDGKIFLVVHNTVSPDGKTITSIVESKAAGTVATYTLIKQ